MDKGRMGGMGGRQKAYPQNVDKNMYFLLMLNPSLSKFLTLHLTSDNNQVDNFFIFFIYNIIIKF